MEAAKKMKQKPIQPNETNRSGKGMTVIAIAAAVIVTVSIVLLWTARTAGSSNSERKALRVGEETYSVAQMDFFYFSTLDELLQNANGYTSMLGLDATKDLSKQACPMSEDGESWKAYLIRQAQESLTKVHVLCAEAEKSGFALDSAAQSEIDSELEYYQFLGQNAGYEDFAAYLTNTFGEGLNAETLRGLLEKIYLADRFEQTKRASFSFTDEQLQQYYSENEYLYMRYTYLLAYVDGSKNVDAICSILSTEKTPEAFEKATLEQTGEESYRLTNVKGSELGDQTAEDVAWLTNANRRAGDTFVGKTEAAGYVLYFVEKNDSGFAGGTGDDWKAEARSALQQNFYLDWLSKATETYTIKEYKAIEKAGTR